MKFFLSILVILGLGYVLLNKFAGPKYCDKFSGQEQNYTKELNQGMRKCQDNFLCKIGKISDYDFHGYKTKKWKCTPKIGEYHILEEAVKKD